MKRIETAENHKYAKILYSDLDFVFCDDMAPINETDRFTEETTINSENWENFKKLASQYTEEQLAAAICKAEFFDSDSYEKYYDFLPSELGRLANQIMQIKEGDSVLE